MNKNYTRQFIKDMVDWIEDDNALDTVFHYLSNVEKREREEKQSKGIEVV